MYDEYSMSGEEYDSTDYEYYESLYFYTLHKITSLIKLTRRIKCYYNQMN